jgi:AmmeMemoRadiSam system protein A
VFVTLRKGKELRGCIGTLEPRWPTVAQEIILNAIAAATEDPRFPPVEEEELAQLLYEIDMLAPLESITDESELDPQRYGVAVEGLGRRGVLLPAIDGISSPSEQVAIAKRKAGLAPDCSVRLYRFEVQRFREDELQRS